MELDVASILAGEDAIEGHRAGFVSIVGKPNVGKSTLLNALLGQKLAAVTHKASTTRQPVQGIMNGADYQLVFVDTPGVIKTHYELHRLMMQYVGAALKAADVVVLMIAPEEKFPEEELIKFVQGLSVPVILAVNKLDITTPEVVQERIEAWRQHLPLTDAIALSAQTGFNVAGLQEMLIGYLPTHPPYFPKDQRYDRPESFFAAELIREQVFKQYQEEIPYSAEVVIESLSQREDGIIDLRAIIYVEREGQKGILIGKKGEALKKTGTWARRSLEEFLGEKVFLQLVVRVAERWKEHRRYLKEFGYEDPTA